jgi:hypothetical protein
LLFVLLTWTERRKEAIALGVVGVLLRVLTVANTIGTMWMLDGLAWFSVMAFYAMTALWAILLVLLFRNRERAALLAGWMIPLAVLEGVGSLGSLATMLTGALLGALRLELRSMSAAVFAVAQIFFLLRTARIL